MSLQPLLTSVPTFASVIVPRIGVAAVPSAGRSRSVSATKPHLAAYFWTVSASVITSYGVGPSACDVVETVASSPPLGEQAAITVRRANVQTRSPLSLSLISSVLIEPPLETTRGHVSRSPDLDAPELENISSMTGSGSKQDPQNKRHPRVECSPASTRRG